MSANNGGPAFPCDNIVERNEKGYIRGPEKSSSGISIRDYFAAKAMSAFIVATSDHSGVHPQNDERVAERAFEMADAMIEERIKE